jgi:hypothetical protein
LRGRVGEGKQRVAAVTFWRRHMHYMMLLYESEGAFENRKHTERDEFWGP